MVYSAVAATIAALFQPVPALADPAAAPPDTFSLAVPDAGARPTALGTLTLPGQRPATPTPVPTLAGAATSPVLQQIEKGRNAIAALGDQLIEVEQNRNLARDQQTAAQQKYRQATETLQRALTRPPAQRFDPVLCTDPTGAVLGLLRLEDLASARHAV